MHRVGRTGRLAKAGHAFSFFTRALAPLAPALLALLQVGGRLFFLGDPVEGTDISQKAIVDVECQMVSGGASGLAS